VLGGHRPGAHGLLILPFDALLLLQDVLGLNTKPGEAGAPAPLFADFESLYAAFRERLAAHVDEFHRASDAFANDGFPATLISLFVEDCIEKGRGYYDRGPRYCIRAPHAGGLPDVANSLLAIRKVVYEDRAR